MNKYRLDRIVKGKWEMFGMYTEKSISQLAQHVSNLTKEGYEMYKDMRIVLVRDDGKSNIL